MYSVSQPKYPCACTRLHCILRLQERWTVLDCCHYFEHCWYTPTGLRHHDCCKYVPAHHLPPGWHEYGYDGDTYIMSPPLNKGSSREVGSLKTRWFLCYRWVCLITTITWHAKLITCKWKLNQLPDWKLAWKHLCNQSDVHGNHHSICWEMILHVYMTDLNTWQTKSAS